MSYLTAYFYDLQQKQKTDTFYLIFILQISVILMLLCKYDHLFTWKNSYFFKKSLSLPGPEVRRMGMSIIQGQEVVLFFYGKRQEHELDSTSFLPDDDPCAVCPIGVAIGKAWRFYTAISSFHCTATCVDET